MTRPSGADGGQLYARSLSVSARSVAAPPRLKEADPNFSPAKLGSSPLRHSESTPAGHGGNP
jgi:hypothetical protein